MTTFELIEQLSKKDKAEIEMALTLLMQAGKINFLSVQQAYVQYLEALKERNLSHAIEAETCVLESLIYDKIPIKDAQTEISVQRRLYLLNKNKRFQMHRLNEKFKYDEERAKEYNHEEDIEFRK